MPLVVFLFFYLFFSAYKVIKDRALNEFNAQQLTLAEQSSRGIENFFNYYQRELLFLSELDEIVDLNEQGKKILSAFYLNHRDQIEAITMVNENGILTYTFPFNKDVIGNNISGQAHVKHILETHKPTISDVFTAVQGFRAIAYHIPVFSKKDIYKGSLAILIPLNKIGKIFIESIKTGETGFGSMISEDGIKLFSPFPEEEGKPVSDIFNKYPSVLRIIERSLKEDKGTAICYKPVLNNVTEKPVKTLTLFFRVTLDNTFWTILIFTPEKEVFSTLASFRNLLFLLCTLVIFVMATFFFMALRASSVISEEKKRREVDTVLRESEMKAREELILSKEKAEESDRLKSAFLANMSHELRTPLNAIIGFSSLMIDTGKDKETVDHSTIILNSGQHLLHLVEDILDTTMIEIGQYRINYESTGVHTILSEVNNIIIGERIKENKGHISIILKIDPECKEPILYTDPRKVKQVLINLLKNSLKFTEEGSIEFGYSDVEKSDKKFTRFYVKDTGIGIDEKHHDIIFNIFRQIDDTRTRKYGGTGLGLSVAKKIVELLGGEIWVESEPGKGTVFFFTLPNIQVIKQTEPVDLIGPLQPEASFYGKTVLVAEDEFTNFEYLRIFLKNLNIRVLWAKNGLEAIKLCETTPSIDLVFMDIKMPGVNGYDATRKIKLKRPGLPVIALTAYATIADKNEALESGCNDYLPKPLKIAQLRDIVVKHL